MARSAQQIILKALAAVLIVLIGAIGWTGFKLWRSWDSVEKVDFDIAGAREVLTTAPREVIEVVVTSPEGVVEVDIGEDTIPDEFVIPPPQPVADELHGVFLAVGSESQIGGTRADVILVFMIPEGGGRPLLVSLPRDLYIKSPCTGKFNRINVNLNGCGEVSGPELLAVAVEDFTGLRIDNMALFDFEGFKKVIDGVGGIEICTANAVRDSKAELQLNAGCTNASGAQALSWVRSRSTLELVDGQWRRMRGVSDLTRNQRQQDVILQMLVKMRNFDSLGDLSRTIQNLADAFQVDEGLSIGEAAELAWSLRGLDPATIARVEIPVRNYTTPRGAQVLIATKTFTELLAEVYPELADE